MTAIEETEKLKSHFTEGWIEKQKAWGRFLPLKQPNYKTCLHTTLAMITGNTIDYVINWFDTDNPITAEDGIMFLVHHGIYPAMYAGYRDPENGEYFKLEKGDKIEFSMPIENRPALLTVWSERFEGKHHSVFWDGKKVHDPNPDVLKPRSISTYKIIEFWPLLMTQQQYSRIVEE